VIKKWHSVVRAGNLENKRSVAGEVRRGADAFYARGRRANPTYCEISSNTRFGERNS